MFSYSITFRILNFISFNKNASLLFLFFDFLLGCEYIRKKYAIGKEIVDNGKTYWLPIVDDVVKPLKGMSFVNLDVAYKFYEEYAKKIGFKARKGTQKPTKNDLGVKLKYFVCSREGFKSKKAVTSTKNETNKTNETNETMDIKADVDVMDSSANKQTCERPSQRCGCETSVRLRLTVDGRYLLYVFNERHNHALVYPEYMVHFKSQRKLDYYNKRILHKLADASFGPFVGYRILTKLHGGHENVGATAVDCKNYHRDVIAYIGKADAQMVVNMLSKKRDCLPNFFFDYFVDDKKELGGLFWADDEMRRYYRGFGDIMSFDATFNSNK